MRKQVVTPEEAQEASEAHEEPTHSETRPRQPGEAQLGRAPASSKSGGSRASVRPSAFGQPRPPSYSSVPPPPPSSQPPPSERPPATSSSSGKRSSIPPAPSASRPPSVAPVAADSSARAPAPSALQSQRPAPPIFDEEDEDAETRIAIPRIQNERSRVVEQLTAEVPAPASVRPPASLPAPRATPSVAPSQARATPSVAPGHQRDPQRSRRPWGSIALFCGMLGLSVVPLLRYARSHEALQPPPPALALPSATPQPIVTSVAMSAARANEVAAEAEAKAAVEREQQLASLVAAGNRALDAEAIPEAERLFGRVVELDEDNPRAAFGLARIRLLQNNLSGAEGWVQLALRKRSKRRSYHALYAEILRRMGRDDEAREEIEHAQQKGDDEEH